MKPLKYLFFIFLVFTLQPCSYSQTMKQKDSLKFSNKIVPDEIWREAYVALSHYPELKDTPIEFRFKKNIKKNFMQAQPKLSGVFKTRKHRSYVINMNAKINIEGQEFDLTKVPSDVLIGWLGHELGHVMDYRNRGTFGMIWFGIKYITSNNYIQEAERAADTYAVNHGMGKYIIATKDFILNHAHLTQEYKDRIKKLYLSQEEIMVLVNDLKAEKG